MVSHLKGGKIRVHPVNLVRNLCETNSFDSCNSCSKNFCDFCVFCENDSFDSCYSCSKLNRYEDDKRTKK